MTAREARLELTTNARDGARRLHERLGRAGCHRAMTYDLGGERR